MAGGREGGREGGENKRSNARVKHNINIWNAIYKFSGMYIFNFYF